MTNNLLDNDATLVYGEPFESLGFRFASAFYDCATQQIHVELKNGLKFAFAPTVSRAFAGVSEKDLSEVEVNEWSVFFPRIDDGFSLEPLAFGDFGNPPWDSAFLSAFQSSRRDELTVAEATS